MIRPAVAGAMLAAATALSTGAAASGAPAFKPDRTAEDHSHLRAAAPAERGYKFIALDRQAAGYLSLGGELRTRAEAFDAPRFGIGSVHDSYLLQRILLHGDLHIRSSTRVFAQIGIHEAVGRKSLVAADEDLLDLQQFFVELRPARHLALRLGRQELAFNPVQRFVNFRETSNVRLSFDGARATFQSGHTALTAFAVRPVATERGVFDNEPNRDVAFAGIYAARRLSDDLSVDAYWHWLDRDNVRFGDAAGDEKRHSFGIRTSGAAGSLDWDAEVMLQRGSFSGQDIRAWGGGAELGYQLRGGLKPRLAFRLDGGSGDHGSADRKLNTFNPLFPRTSYLGEAGLMSFSNLVSARTSLRLLPKAGLEVEGSAALNRRADGDDLVYTAPSVPIAATRAGRSKDIGRQYSVGVRWQASRHVAVQAALVHHSAGGAIRAAGGRAADFATSSVQIRF